VAEYPVIELDDLEVLAVGPPPGRISHPLFMQLKKHKSDGRQITAKFLDAFATEHQTTAENVRATLRNNREFERVPGKPAAEEWWRVRQLRPKRTT